MLRSVRLALLGAALIPGTAVAGQDAPAEADAAAAAPKDGRQVFERAYFDRFAPKTAYDMVAQLPGFSVQSAEERRGLGQATENVLINGERISGKSNDAVTALGRINASDVTRVEIIDGATLDIPGLSGQVANIVTSVKKFTGNFRYSPQFRSRGTKPRLLDGEISISGKLGKADYTLSLSNESARQGNAGPETVTDGLGIITDIRPEVLHVNREAPRLAGTFKRTAANGNILNLNGSVQHFYQLVAEDSIRIDRRRDYAETEHEWNYEIGGDYEFALGGGKLKLIGLRRFEHSPFRTRVVFDFYDNRPDAGDLFLRTADEGESIARAEYRWKAGKADWQVSAEGALNTLNNRSSLAQLDAQGQFQPVPLPDGNASVKEKRGEIAISYGRPLSGSLTLQSSIGAEWSNITQAGAGGLNRTFYRPKGFISVAWKASSVLDISAKVEREVGQLNFYDFVASVNLAGGNGNAGNPNLRPPQSWNAELEFKRSMGEWGSARVKLFAKFLSDAVAQVPVGANGEAPGNIDKARLIGFDWTSTINFDPIGWKGAKLDMSAYVRNSRLKDPLTGERRQLSESTLAEINLNFRQDIPKSDWAWGVEYYRFIQTAGTRLDQTSQFIMQPGDLGVFVEHKDVFGLKVRGGVYNLLESNERFYRTVYQGGRRTNAIAFTEDRSRYAGLVFDFRVSGSF